MPEPSFFRPDVKNETQPPSASPLLQGPRLGAVSVCVLLYTLLVGTVFPLYMDDGLTSMADSKALWFLLHTLLLALLLPGCLWLQRRGAAPCAPQHANPGFTPAQAALLVFAWAVVLSALLAEDKLTAVWGWRGRNMGLATLLAGVFACFAVGRWLPQSGRALWARLFSLFSCLVSLLALLNFAGWDPLHLYTVNPYYELAKPLELWMAFLSTLGNTNTVAGFLCLVLPVALCGVAATGAGRWRGVFGTAFVLGWAALLCAGSDGAYIALVAVGLVAACLPGFCLRHLLQSLPTVAVALCVGGLLGALYRLAPPAIHRQSGLALLVGHPAIALPSAALCLFAFLLLRRKVAAAPALAGKALHRPGRLAAFACVGVAAAVLLVANLLPVGTLPPGLENVLVFGDGWGSYRGGIWRALCSVWLHRLPPLQKLLGAGPDSIATLLDGPEGAELFASTGLIVDAAHNEYLQLLLTLGLLGLVAWLAVVFLHLRQAFGQGAGRTQRALGLAAVGYCVQAFFGIATTSVWPLFCVVLGLLHAQTPGSLAKPKPRALLAGAAALILLEALLCFAAHAAYVWQYFHRP